MANEVSLRVYPDLLYTYRGHSLLATGRAGEIESGLQGLYEYDARILSRYKMVVNGQTPRLDALSAVDPYSTLAYYVCPPSADAEIKMDALGLAEEEADRQV